MRPRILIAGIGNIFLGDDAFGVEVARRLMSRPWPEEVSVADFGIRGLDLAYALLDNPEAVLLIDAVPCGGEAGTLYVIEPDLNGSPAGAESDNLIEAHSMDLVKVLRMAARMGAEPRRVVVIGCEPGAVPAEDEVVVEMSAPVLEAVERTVELVTEMVDRLLRSEPPFAGSKTVPDKI